MEPRKRGIQPWSIIEADLLEALSTADLIKSESQGKQFLEQAFWKYAMLDDEFVDFHDRQWLVDRQATRIAEIMLADRERETLSSTEKERYDLIKSIVYPPLLKHYGPEA